MAKKQRENRVPIMMSDDELETIDDWRFKNRIATRSDAVRRLAQIGMLAEFKLEQAVDSATECLDGIGDRLLEANADRLAIIPAEEGNIQYTRDEAEDIIFSASRRDLVTLEAIEELHLKIVAIYNAIVPFAKAKSLRKGIDESRHRLIIADEAIHRAREKRKELEENRYLSILLATFSVEQKRAYEAMSETDQEQYLTARVSELASAEQAEPIAFAEHYGLRRFWEEPDWPDQQRERLKRALEDDK